MNTMTRPENCFQKAEDFRDSISELISSGRIPELNAALLPYDTEVVLGDDGEIRGHSGNSSGIPLLGPSSKHDPDLMKLLNGITLQTYQKCSKER